MRSLLSISNLARDIASAPDEKNVATEPSFINSYFMGVDAIALMAFLRDYRPSLLLEIGSGNSTRFARRAIRDFQLPMKVVSCDPKPRADIRMVCDVILQQPAETLAHTVFDRLRPGDVLFIDSSHRILQNSDVTTLFLEILPRPPSGAIIQFHDILLPYDYPSQWVEWCYSEQCLLALWPLINPE